MISGSVILSSANHEKGQFSKFTELAEQVTQESATFDPKPLAAFMTIAGMITDELFAVVDTPFYESLRANHIDLLRAKLR